jgi:hypothetical protein
VRYWWVNQNQTYRQEIEGGYLWSPKRNANGARNPFYEFMREVAPGDLVFSFVDTRIAAVRLTAVGLGEKPQETLLAAQRAAVDPGGVLRFDITSTPIPLQTGSIKISIICDSKSNGRKQDFSVPLQPTSDKLITMDSQNPCFE